ncbi:hypothetical protein GWI34_34555 [Actinomadura sp. DSM 109109]|nr:hypothetical protein [Actinomadura lepetitiana]
MGRTTSGVVNVPWNGCYDAGATSLIGDAAFTLAEGATCPAETGRTCAVPVAFRPRTAGTFSTTLVVRDRDGGVRARGRVTATATESCLHQGASEVEGAEVGRTVERYVTFEPPPCFQGEDITFGTEPNPAFRLAGADCGFSEGAYCDLALTFTPREETGYSATVVMRNGAGRVVGTHTVSAQGLPPEDDDDEDCPPGTPDGCPTPEEPAGGRRPGDRPAAPEPRPSGPKPGPSGPEDHGDAGAPTTPEKPDEPEKPRPETPDEPETPTEPEPEKPASPHHAPTPAPEPSTAPQPKVESSGRAQAVPTTS